MPKSLPWEYHRRWWEKNCTNPVPHQSSLHKIIDLDLIFITVKNPDLSIPDFSMLDLGILDLRSSTWPRSINLDLFLSPPKNPHAPRWKRSGGRGGSSVRWRREAAVRFGGGSDNLRDNFGGAVRRRGRVVAGRGGALGKRVRRPRGRGVVAEGGDEPSHIIWERESGWLRERMSFENELWERVTYWDKWKSWADNFKLGAFKSF